MTRIVAALLLSATSAFAGWDNVFQLTCCDGSSSRASYYTAPPVTSFAPPATDCEPKASVSYVQRSYYQPETTYRSESYYVPVKENVKSYYYEPVTSYKYTSYYDPCTGCCQKLATPVTSYVQKEKCNSVTRWVEQTRQVPVTSYRAVTSYTPVVTYYYPPVSNPSSFKIPVAPPVAPLTPPSVIESAPSSGDAIPKQTLPTNPQSNPRVMPPKTSTQSNAYTASRSKAILSGDVVANDRLTPRGETKVIFVNAKDKSRVEAMTDRTGNFDMNVPAGEWHVYLGTGTGQAVFHKTMTIASDDVRDLTLVSR